jgi:cAMP-dependent protein kinase regulator
LFCITEVLLDYERSKIAETLEEVTFPNGHPIVKQGDVGDTFFILKKGEVIITVNKNGVDKEVARCKVGDYFGER